MTTQRRTIEHIKRLAYALDGMVTAVKSVDAKFTLYGAGTILKALEEAEQAQREHMDWLLSDRDGLQP